MGDTSNISALQAWIQWFTSKYATYPGRKYVVRRVFEVRDITDKRIWYYERIQRLLGLHKASYGFIGYFTSLDPQTLESVAIIDVKSGEEINSKNISTNYVVENISGASDRFFAKKAGGGSGQSTVDVFSLPDIEFLGTLTIGDADVDTIFVEDKYLVGEGGDVNGISSLVIYDLETMEQIGAAANPDGSTSGGVCKAIHEGEPVAFWYWNPEAGKIKGRFVRLSDFSTIKEVLIDVSAIENIEVHGAVSYGEAEVLYGIATAGVIAAVSHCWLTENVRSEIYTTNIRPISTTFDKGKYIGIANIYMNKFFSFSMYSDPLSALGKNIAVYAVLSHRDIFVGNAHHFGAAANVDEDVFAAGWTIGEYGLTESEKFQLAAYPISEIEKETLEILSIE